MSSELVRGTPVRRAGYGHAPCHFGEILQGIFRDPSGRPQRALVTLPLHAHGTRAHFTRVPGVAEVSVSPGDRAKARRVAELTLRHCAQSTGTAGGGQLVLTGDVPVGLGMGSSTSDIIATVRAVAASFGTRIPPDTIARLAVAAEGASDPLMLDDRPVLFAQREARVVEVLGEALPSLVVVGCVTGGGAAVDTLAMPAPPCTPGDLDVFEDLRADLRTAVATGDAGLLGAVSTRSARVNQRVLPKPEFDVLAEVAATTGAVGFQVAHSGNVAGILFDGTESGVGRKVRAALAALRVNGVETKHLFRAGRGARLGEDPVGRYPVPGFPS